MGARSVRRFGMAASAVLLTGAAVVSFVVLAGDDEAREPTRTPSPSSPAPAVSPDYATVPGPLRMIDQAGGGDRFPGGIARLSPGNGGGWLIVYQRFVGEVAEIFARETPDLLVPPGAPTLVSNPLADGAYDPGAIELPNGRVVVTWTTKQAIWTAERLGPGRYGPPRQFFTDPGGADSEQTLADLGDVQAVFYDFHPFRRAAFVWDPRMRRLAPGPGGVMAGPPVSIAVDGPGYGTEGVQRRVTAAPTGSPGGAIAVWSQHAAEPCAVPTEHPGDVQNCGPRPVFGSLSFGEGAGWDRPSMIALVPDHDLVNPFAILVAPNDLRVYFTVDRRYPDVGYVRSADHGRTWTAVRYLATPKDLTAARMVFEVDPANGLVGMFTSKGFDRLVTLVVEKLPFHPPSA